MINLYLNNSIVIPFKPIELPEMEVNRETDNSMTKPKAEEFEMTIENKTNHVLTQLEFETNMPNKSYYIYDMPREVQKNQTAKFILKIYPRLILDDPGFPETVYMNVHFKENMETR